MLLEPLKSLTHSEVRRAFTRCVLRSRTLPALVRSDRGPEFKNALMKELATMLGSEWRFSAPLRLCEMGSNERVHQEVQKVLGAIVRQSLPNTSSITPQGLTATPQGIWRDHGVSASLSKRMSSGLPCSSSQSLTESLLEKSSEARARLANRHRRAVDGPLRGGGSGSLEAWSDRPLARSRRGHRLTLGPVPDPSGGTLSAAKGPHEAHAKDCILVPPDAEGPRAEHPVVFEHEDEQHPGAAGGWGS